MQVIEYILLLYFGLSAIYISLFSIAALWYKKSTFNKYQDINKRVAILVPAYKEDDVILSVAENLLAQQYPVNYYDIFIIADSFKRSTIKALKDYPIQVFDIKFQESTKVKSLNYALQRIPVESYDIAVISDADNFMKPDFLSIINDEFSKGNHFLQGRRVAKNINTSIGVLDTANEIINNHIFRKGFNSLNLSSSLIGSGMAFPFTVLKSYLSRMNAVGGFDKELQLKIIEEGNQIKYLENAIVYDEKIESTEAFKHQRRRWVSSHYSYLAKHFFKGIEMLFKGNISYFNIAVLYNLLLPRMITIGFLSIIALTYLLWQDFLHLPAVIWMILILVYVGSLLLPIPISLYGRLFRSIKVLPRVILIMMRSLLNMKSANKKFLHTTHSKTVVDNDLV
ncbi:MAG: glycosyltransferase [Cyclobacteriaceae bacterium]